MNTPDPPSDRLWACGTTSLGRARWKVLGGQRWRRLPLRDLAVPSLSEVDGDSPVRHHKSARAEHADGLARQESPVILIGTPRAGSPHACVRTGGTMLKHCSPASTPRKLWSMCRDRHMKSLLVPGCSRSVMRASGNLWTRVRGSGPSGDQVGDGGGPCGQRHDRTHRYPQTRPGSAAPDPRKPARPGQRRAALVRAARGASACCLGSVPAAESAGEVRALFLGWTRRLVPKPDQKPEPMNA
jgi:hypothetical protein